ncbi:MAG: hypothetical protein ACRBI6_21825 [Acidimicrobiales bacterium]
MSSAVKQGSGVTEGSTVEAERLERRGRLWLLWSFVICPCHLPLTLALVGATLGGTALGALVVDNALETGIVLGLLYAAGLTVGFRRLLEARRRGARCGPDGCRVGGERN